MNLDSFAFSGSDLLLKKSGIGPVAPAAEKHPPVRSKGGGGLSAHRKQGNASESDPSDTEEKIPLEPEKAPEAKVKLFNLKWENDSGIFGAKTKASAQAELPENRKDITRIIFTLFALRPNGEKEHLERKDGHLRDGIAEVEFLLPHSPGKDAATEASRSFCFTAKHRDSDEPQSPFLKAENGDAKAHELILELEDAAEVKTRAYVFALSNAEGSYKSALKFKDGMEKDGKLTLKFAKLKAEGKYTLELHDAEGKLLEKIFSDRLYGEWET